MLKKEMMRYGIPTVFLALLTVFLALSAIKLAAVLDGCSPDGTETPPAPAATNKPVGSKSDGTEWIPVGLTKPVAGKTYDFIVVDIAGKTITSRHLHGKVVVIDFWATWCPPCLKAIPDLRELHDRYHDKGLEIVGIGMDGRRGDLERFVERTELPWPQVWGGTLVESLDKAGIRAIPTYLVINRDGKLVKRDHVVSSSLIKELVGE